MFSWGFCKVIFISIIHVDGLDIPIFAISRIAFRQVLVTITVIAFVVASSETLFSFIYLKITSKLDNFL